MATPHLCGYRQPDKSRHHLDGTYDFSLKSPKKHTVELSVPNVASAELGNGTWTMVYDEGFFVSLPKMEFFAFHAYKAKEGTSLNNIKPENYISFCDRTLIGWYMRDRKFGCWRGKQVKKAYPKLVFTSSSIPKTEVDYAVVSPIDLDSKFLEEKYDPDYSFIEMHNSATDSLWKAEVHTPFLHKTNGEMLKLAGGLHYTKSIRPPSQKSSPITEEQEQFFTSLISASETVTVLSEEKQTKREFLEADADLDAEAEAEAEADADADADADVEPATSKKKTTASGIDAKLFQPGEKTCDFGLPCALDWRNRFGQNWIPKIRNQGHCGSCYAFAFMTVMESRLRIATKNPNRPLMSPQHVVSCSVYNQGCDGGFPFLVGKHIEHFGAVSEKCFPYVASDSQCSRSCGAKPEFPIAETRYVGNYFGNNSEEAMMRELMSGPITVAFESPKTLFAYKGGIFTGPRPRSEDQQVKGVRPWQHTNHAVVAVGWGSSIVNGQRVKYWIFQNSWGETWGESGHFRIIRGRDECGVESMSVTTTPII